MNKNPLRMHSILLSLCEIVIGILLLIDPAGFTKGIVVFLGVVLLLSGIVDVVQYFRLPPAEAALGQKLTRGLMGLSAGLFCVLKSGWFVVTFPVLTVIYGVFTLVTGFAKVQWTVDMLRAKRRRWGWVAVNAAVTLVFAAVILGNPFGATAVLWTFVAVALIVEAIADIIIAIFAKVD